MAPTPDIATIFEPMVLETNKAMDRYTSFRVGGPADYLACPQTVEEVIMLVKAAQKAGLPITVIGGGTNVLVTDKGIRGLVIVLTRLKKQIEQTDLSLDNDPSKTKKKPIRLTALAGTRFTTLSRHAADSGLSGLEWAAGIPGTLGGAIMMNAGAHGQDMAGIVKRIEVLNLSDFDTNLIKRNELEFSYRKLELNNCIILKAELELAQNDPEKVKTAFFTHLKEKQATQPVSLASAGCFFKNPPGFKSAGWLIEQAGLKGTRCNGAMVSELHANFIVNQDRACASDIVTLAEQVRQGVFKKFGINLKEEVKIIGT